MSVFRCEEISCEHCVSRIHNGLTAAGIKHEIDLGSKKVTIEGDEAVDIQAVEVLDDLGFSAEKM